MKEKCLSHRFPVWQERGDAVVHTLVEESQAEVVWEELWVRTLGSNVFEVCCIPLWVRNLAVGDLIEATPDDRKGWILKKVVQPSGNYTFRMLFDESTSEEVKQKLHQDMKGLGCLLEWRSAVLWGVSSRPESAQAVADLLWGAEQNGILSYETGRI